MSVVRAGGRDDVSQALSDHETSGRVMSDLETTDDMTSGRDRTACLPVPAGVG
jgi:hypothetical protein